MRQHKNTWVTHEFRLAVVTSYESVGIQDTIDSFFPELEGTALDTKRKSVYLWATKKDKTIAMCVTVAEASSRGFRQLEIGTSLTADADQDLVRWGTTTATKPPQFRRRFFGCTRCEWPGRVVYLAASWRLSTPGKTDSASPPL
ncbi:Protein Y6B3B.8 [Phytophthora cinnamomi]|uniref:Protein Y6B3B.8 n=1 Tax=Phytophthora cinnamomi TaxID=4785 RepID=UPI00355A0AF4|nr:Protein Y6B3B.8 [Phytophthora cinnamomi]